LIGRLAINDGLKITGKKKKKKVPYNKKLSLYRAGTRIRGPGILSDLKGMNEKQGLVLKAE